MKKEIRAYRLWSAWVLAFATALWLSGCCDESSLVVEKKQDVAQTVTLRISTPDKGNSSSTRATFVTDEAVHTVDVLVLTGSGDDDYVISAVKGDPVAETTNRFKVTLPVGTGLEIHLFVNCREELIARGFFQSSGKKRSFILPWLTLANTRIETTDSPGIGMNVPAGGLPMYGILKNQTVSVDMTDVVLPVNVLRSVVGAQVLLNATGDATGGYKGNALSTFELRECYAYFQSMHGRIIPKDNAGFDGTSAGQVTGISLPDEILTTIWQDNTWVNGTRTNLVEVMDLPATTVQIGFPDYCYKVGGGTSVYSLPSLYLFENKKYTADGNDLKGSVVGNMKVATTRLVVGGIYKGTDPTNTKMTYYRLNFLSNPSDKNTCHDLLRNHKYIFNIKSVTGPGYDTPNAAATGVPVNIDVVVIDWVPSKTDVDFDAQNYFSAESKQVTLPRAANATKKVTVKTDVLATDWKMSFDKTNWVTGNTLSNIYFTVTRTAVDESGTDKKYTLSFTSQQAYNASVSHAATLYVQAKNLTVAFTIGQEDRMPDDWGDGGNEDFDLNIP